MPVYAYRFVGTPWVKVGYEKHDVTTRAADGWWNCSHPPELCQKLDIRHVELIGVWQMSKEEEMAMHRHFHGEGPKTVSYTHLRAHET